MEERDIGDEILEGLKNAVEFAKGEKSKGKETVIRVPVIDVKAIRTKQGMTQKDFAKAYGFNLDTLKNWEQNRRRPERTAQLLLAAIDQEPALIHKIVKDFDKPVR